MEILLSASVPVMDSVAQSIKLYLKGNTEKAFKLLFETEEEIQEIQKSKDQSFELPEWFDPWRKAILRKDYNKAKTLLPPPSDFLKEYNIKIKHLMRKNPEYVLSNIINLYNNTEFDEAINMLKKLRDKHPGIYSDHPAIIELESDYGEIMKVLQLITDKEGWILESAGSITVRYKNIEGTKTCFLMTEAEVDVPYVNYIALVFESDLFHHWVPFCRKSVTIAKLGKSKKIISLDLKSRILPKRHSIIYGFGANMLSTLGCTVIYCRSCDQEMVFKGVRLPEFPTKRSQINDIAFVIRPITLNKIHITLLMNYDPKTKYIPYKIINFFSRKLAKGIFKKISKLAVNFVGSEYEDRMRAEESREFYEYLKFSQIKYLKSLENKK